jgi:hypothetical protein
VATKQLGLYDLLAPQLLTGSIFPDHIDSYLSFLKVESDGFHSSFDDAQVVYSGRLSFGESNTLREHHDPSGAILTWDDVSFDFRLTVNRKKSTLIESALALLPVMGPVNATEVQNLLARFEEPGSSTISDYPDLAFKLELRLNSLKFHLGKSWQPGKEGPNHRVIADTAAPSKDVTIVLPNISLEYRQTAEPTADVEFHITSWGSGSFDGPHDLATGEVVRMEPPLAIHESGRYAFGLGQVLLDLSTNATPPEILEHFGTDENWTGVFVKSARFYYADENKDWAFQISVSDALISFTGEVSLEAALDIFGKQNTFEVQARLFDGPREILAVAASAVVPSNVVIHAEVSGGAPPFITAMLFTPNGGAVRDLWNASRRDGRFEPPPTARVTGSLVVRVTDAAGIVKTTTLGLTVTPVNETPTGSELDRPASTRRAPATLTPGPGVAALPSGYVIRHAPAESGTVETITVEGGDPATLPTVLIDGTARPLSPNRQLNIDVPAGRTLNIQVDWPGVTVPATFELLFGYFRPRSDDEVSLYIANRPAGDDNVWLWQNTVPPKAGALQPATPARGADALRFWLQNGLVPGSPVNIIGHASSEGAADLNKSLSERRALVAAQIVQSSGLTVTTSVGRGELDSRGVANPADRRVILTGTPKNTVAQSATASISRPAASPPPQPRPNPANPLPQVTVANKPPPVFRSLRLRVRLERNVPVLLEVSGSLDLETELEARLRNPPAGETPSPPLTDGNLGLKGVSGSNGNNATTEANPQDGVVDFAVVVDYDTATQFVRERLSLGAHPDDKDGLLRAESTTNDTFKNVIGSMLIFLPITNATVGAVQSGGAGEWAALGVSLAVPIAIGLLDVIRTQRITLYGAELRLRQHIPDGLASTEFTDAAVVFDYGVEFGISISALNIQSTRPLKVRYKAIGFNLHFGNPFAYQPVFDTSRGYDLNLSDPGLFKLPAPLDNILRIVGARVARFNPLTLELDLAITADLGVITVDRFKVKIPLDPPGVPTIMPSGVRVNIPGALIGSGRVEILDGGFSGSLDLTLVPLKLRVSADVSVQSIKEGNRSATAVFLGLALEFPAPILLGASGLGIFGFNGLFAMHFRRIEAAPDATMAIPPALKWLETAGGQPQRFEFNGVKLWEPALDRWSFGIGAVLGTVDGGFLLNLRGMFILELPGPRILIVVKLQIISGLPKLGAGGLTTGILGVLDLDFGRGTITLGVLIDFKVEKLLEVRIPIELFVDTNQPTNWHLFIGTIKGPVTVRILGIVRGTGYFMIGGQEIVGFPPGTAGRLPGIALATGFGAAVIWGSESAGIYLKVAISADLGISFSEGLFIAGRIRVEGELRLLIVSIGASGSFDLIARTNPDQVYLKVQVCGSVSFFFFSVSACISFEIGSKPNTATAPSLVKGVYLQSFAPVVVAGQGGDRPIDASLGDARRDGDASPLPVVPLDAVPVVQFLAGPDAAGLGGSLQKPGPLDAGLQRLPIGDNFVALYKLTKVTLTPSGGTPLSALPATWRRNSGPNGTATTVTNVDLAINSRQPFTAARALERSTTLTEVVTYEWGSLCEPIAPPACVLFTNCGQVFGPSGQGWTLRGIVWPDPPGTKRDAPATTIMRVEEPGLPVDLAQFESLALMFSSIDHVPAMVIGIKDPKQQRYCPRALQLPGSFFIGKTESPEIKPDLKTEILKATEAVLEARLNQQYLTFVTGAAERVRLLMATNPRLQNQFEIRELDALGNVIVTHTPSSLDQLIVNSFADLPTNWQAPGGPWLGSIKEVFSVFKLPRLDSFKRAVYTLKPKAETIALQVFVKDKSSVDFPPPTVVVGAIEVCSKAERQRAEQAQLAKDSSIQTLVGYLDGGTPVPLLQPNTEYTLELDYSSIVVKDGEIPDPTKFANQNPERFRFRTDDKAPAKLDPWVLGTSPMHETEYHFFKDPVRLLLNDTSVIDLFKAYGKKLRFEVRAANGRAITPNDLVVTSSVPGFGSPFYDELLALVTSGAFPCVPANGVKPYQHASALIPITLEPLMAYTLDIVTEPATAIDDPSKPITPLYRRAFRTSKYAGIEALCASLRGSQLRHRALTAPFNPPSGIDVMTDLALQVVLSAAGEALLGAPEKGQITVYWVKLLGATRFTPHAVLFDSEEPLWRWRQEPKLETPQSDDPKFKVVRNTQVQALELKELDNNVVRLVRTQAGTRTLALISDGFSPPPGGTPIRFVLNQTASELFEIPARQAMLIDLMLEPNAPWEADDD